MVLDCFRLLQLFRKEHLAITIKLDSRPGNEPYEIDGADDDFGHSLSLLSDMLIDLSIFV